MPRIIESPGEHAARIGKGIIKWVNTKTASGSEETLTDATLYTNIGTNQTLFITGWWIMLETDCDNVLADLVSCAAVAGGGAAVAITGAMKITTAAALTTISPHHMHFDPPLRVPYSTAALSVSMRINSNDASAVISCGYEGYLVDTDPTS